MNFFFSLKNLGPAFWHPLLRDISAPTFALATVILLLVAICLCLFHDWLYERTSKEPCVKEEERLSKVRAKEEFVRFYLRKDKEDEL